MIRKYCIGVDIGGTKMVAGLINASGKILSRKKIATPLKVSAGTLARLIEKLISDLMREQNVTKGMIDGIGLGVPGVIKPDHKTILITPNIRLSHYPLAERLRQKFQTDIVLGNDVNFGLLAEQWLGAARGRQHVIGIFPGTGVGGGIIINGKLYVGAQGAAGELGHMIIDYDNPKAKAGVFGSVEALASRTAIEQSIFSLIKKGKKSIVTKLMNVRTGRIKSRVLSEALKRHDKVVTQVVDYACLVLGKSCISLRHVFNPEMIVLGGGVMEACGGYMLPRVKKISKADPFFKGVDRCDIVLSQLGDDAVMLGAVAALKQQHGRGPSLKVGHHTDITIKSKHVVIDGHVYKNNFYIRADGKIKKVSDDPVFNKFLVSRRIHKGFVERICKKKPQLLVVAANVKNIKIDAEAKAYLKREGVSYKQLSLAKAVPFYNSFDQPKAIFIYQRAR